MIVIDFETRSRVDLRKCGASVYAADPSTDVLCLAFGREIDDVQVWTPEDSREDLSDLIKAIEWGEQIAAHNAFFERNIWRRIMHERYGFPDVPFSQWRCTLAACSRLALPRSLEAAGAALGLDIQKDADGRRLMLKLCKPGRDGEFIEPTGAEKVRLFRYCIRDVQTEIAVHQYIKPLTDSELKVWQLDQRINLRGIPIDREAVEHAIAISETTKGESEDSLVRITEGKVGTPKQVAAFLEWTKSEGVDIPNLRADTVAATLERDDLPDSVRDALVVRSEAGKASTAKLQSMIDHCDTDGRVRGTVLYHGANTGRWAGAGIQIQNFPRGILKGHEVDAVFRLLPDRDPVGLDTLLAPPLHCLSSALRGFIRAEKGKRLIVCDFASIEARVLAWVAGQDDLVEAFREGADVYKVMASSIYDVPVELVDKTQRQMGKVAILGCGYQMGPKNFQRSCKLMAGVDISYRFAKQVVKAYRTKNDRIAAFWREINSAAMRAIHTGFQHAAGRIIVQNDTREGYLKLKLPSGRKLHYRKPELVDVVAPWSEGFVGEILVPNLPDEALEALEERLDDLDVKLGDQVRGVWMDCFVPKTSLAAFRKLGIRSDLEPAEPEIIQQIQFWGVVAPSRRWSTKRTYGGSISENLTQAIARDLLVEAMLRLEAKGYPIIATIHDEIVAEVPEGFGSLEEFESIMSAVPHWAAGCPIGVSGYEGERYRK